jgi:hypothetical protein
MLTLRRFKELAEAYGADLEHWPVDRRAGAQILLQSSAEARAAIEKAAALDEVLMAGRLQADGETWPGNELDVSLARLRAGVAGQIATQNSRSAVPMKSRVSALAAMWLAYRRPLELSAFGALAIVVGLWIGSMSAAAMAPAGGSNAVMALLQPEPVHMLSV